MQIDKCNNVYTFRIVQTRSRVYILGLLSTSYLQIVLSYYYCRDQKMHKSYRFGGFLILGQLLEVLTAVQACNYDTVEQGCEIDRDICSQPFSSFEVSGITSEKANPCHHRYLVSIQEQFPDGGGQDCFYHLCGGVLIGGDLVLTATHCIYAFVNSSEYSGEFIGQLYVSRAPKCRHQRGEARFLVTHYWIYPHFQTRTYLNDIAILKLDNQFKPPYLPPYSLQNNLLADDVDLSIIGWGDTDKLESIQRYPYNSKQLRIGRGMKLLDSLECQNILDEAGEQIEIIQPQMICAQGQFLDSCRGDSGGPLVLTQGGMDSIVGIISFGAGKSQCISSQNVTSPGIFTNVAYYKEWIDAVVELVELLKAVQLEEISAQQMAEQMQRTFTVSDVQNNSRQTSNSITQTQPKQAEPIQIGSVQLSPIQLPLIDTQQIEVSPGIQDGLQINLSIQVIDRGLEVSCEQNNTSNFGGVGMFAELLFPRKKCRQTSTTKNA
eukprot:TRINITY_DN1045_c0_g1_i8.p1 TRINITY_DN1045_c0_g1~~TRINITY_DN1045_c0_g1_i8.p1  ORF type:complete len:492 (-),score=32.62 TRINITY_DN1045_c0_g1_i8:218-1693(-)